jgi:hypothetical protein
MKEEYFTHAEIDELVIPMIKELLSKIPVKAKEIYYKELSHPNNPRIIEIIYINPKTGAVCVDCDDEIPYGTELSELQLNRYDLLNIVRRLRR